MRYRDFFGRKVSALGFGAMRLPKSGERDSDIDVGQVNEMVAYAMKHGVNYYDTAWGYHDGRSEGVLARALADYPRDSYMFATKFPGYNVSNFGKTDEIFEAQLERTGLDRFDFYLLHNVCEPNIERYLDDDRFGTVSQLVRRKEAGQIDHIGLSSHGRIESLRRILERYAGVFDFCQLQVNWIDWDFQKASKMVEILNDLDLPLIIMEPLRGGRILNVPDWAKAKLAAIDPSLDIVEWSFGFCDEVPGVLCTLSGMSNMEQLMHNVKIFENGASIPAAGRAALLEIGREMTSAGSVPCTDCRYCTSHCPKGLDIPYLIDLYNEHRYTENGFIAPMAIGGLPEDKRPSACIGCRRCENVCPQQIHISEVMDDFAKIVKPA